MITLKIQSFPEEQRHLAESNYCYVNEKTYISTGSHTFFDGYALNIKSTLKILDDIILINGITRTKLKLKINDKIKVITKVGQNEYPIVHLMYIKVNFLNKNHVTKDVFTSKYLRTFLDKYDNYLLSVGQIYIIGGSNKILIEIEKIETLIDKTSFSIEYGLTRKDITMPVFIKGNNYPVNIYNEEESTNIFTFNKIDFEKIGIGGVEKQFNEMFRRIFTSRMLAPDLVKKLGLKHCKGIILYGLPGCGKTLLARCIGKMLNIQDIKIVNGPEILNKYVGGSEENVRTLFKDAEKEYAAKGDKSKLHMIIFDEIDAICHHRTSSNSSTNVANNVVNQLLSKIDGVDSLNNILLIGMTNRLDLIDEAILRPGRFGYRLEISLPDDDGRYQILKIHTSSIHNNHLLDKDVDLKIISEKTKNYTGAELESLIQTATSYTIMRQVDKDNINKSINNLESKITQRDFLKALDDIKPAFGMHAEDFVPKSDIIEYNKTYKKLMHKFNQSIDRLKRGNLINIVSVLVMGKIGSGKSTLVSNMVTSNSFPYAKCVLSVNLVDSMELYKCAKISKIFKDSYNSPLSVIVIDNIERIIEYSPIGPRFSNNILETLVTFINRAPPPNSKLMIITTTSQIDVVQRLGILGLFDEVYHIPDLSKDDIHKIILETTKNDLDKVIIPENMTIKDLLLVLDKINISNIDGCFDEYYNKEKLLSSYDFNAL